MCTWSCWNAGASLPWDGIRNGILMVQMPIEIQINLPSFYFLLLCALGAGYQQEQERMYRNSSVGCGCSDSLVVALSLLAVPAFAEVV